MKNNNSNKKIIKVKFVMVSSISTYSIIISPQLLQY